MSAFRPGPHIAGRAIPEKELTRFFAGCTPQWQGILDRMVAKTTVDDAGCWLWQGYLNDSGYGAISCPHNAKARVHRVACAIVYGGVAENEFICHHCDVRRCWNPAHLYIGSIATNTRDMWARNGFAPQFGVRNKNAKLNDERVREIRTLYAQGMGPTAIGAKFGVSASTIARVCLREQWRHVA